jgi:hypothetical protein
LHEEDAVVGRIEYGPGRTGGEALFVPRRLPASKQHGAWQCRLT